MHGLDNIMYHARLTVHLPKAALMSTLSNGALHSTLRRCCFSVNLTARIRI